MLVNELILLLCSIQIQFVMAGVISHSSASAIDTGPTASSSVVFEEVEQDPQAEPDLYDSDDAIQKGPISEGVVVAIVVVLLIVVIFLIALSCVWGSKNWDLILERFRRNHTENSGSRNWLSLPPPSRSGSRVSDTTPFIPTPAPVPPRDSVEALPLYPYPPYAPPAYPPPSLQIK